MDFKPLLQNEKNMGKQPAASYTVAMLEDIDKMLFGKRNTPEKLEEIRNDAKEINAQEGALCLEYTSGRIKLELRPHEFNMDLNNCLISFNNARNWDACEWLGNLILSHSTNCTAYRILGDVAHERGNEKAMWENWEKYAKTNHQDKDFIVDVAKHYEEMGDKKNAGIMYERALLRLDAPQDHQKISECFEALLRCGRNEAPFFLTYTEKIAYTDKGLAFGLLRTLLGYLEKEKASLKASTVAKPAEVKFCQDNIITTLSGLLSIDEKADGIYDRLIAELKDKYKDSSRLAECLRKFFRSSDNVMEHLRSFETEIAYSKGVFVYQKSSRKVGRIMKVEGENISVMYSGSEPLQNINLPSAIQTLVPLSNQNIKAIKKGVPAAKIKARAEADITWLTKTMIYSLTTPDTGKSNCSIRDMKAELVPSIYTDDEWKKVSALIKQEVSVNPYVRILPDATDSYELTPWPSTPDDKMLHIFRTSKTFYEKAQCTLESYKRKDVDKEGDALLEMSEYFEKILETEDEVNHMTISSALVLEMITDEDEANILVTKSFQSLYKTLNMEGKYDVFRLIDNTILKKAFIDRLVKFDKNAPEVLVALMPLYISYISQKLRKISKGKFFYDYLKSVFFSLDKHWDEYMYFVNDLSDEDLSKIGMNRYDFILSELEAYQQSMRRTDCSDLRKQKKTLEEKLIKGNGIVSLIKNLGDDNKDKLYNLIRYNNALGIEEKKEFESMIYSRWPELKPVPVKKVVEKKTVSGFLCLSDSYDQKQAELKEINTVEIPAILKEIAAARELGDLRENSEYQYAKDHKRELERRISELNNDLNTVKIVRHEDVYDDMIGFGTRVILHDNLENCDVEYTFLGRWESRPAEGIIDINAPIGKGLVDHKVGDDVKFEINEKPYDYTVKEIIVII